MEGNLTTGQKVSAFFSTHWKGMFSVLVPIALLPIYFLDNAALAYRNMYILIVMALFWIFEVIPLYVTSLIPIVAFPFCGIMSSEDTCKSYFRDTLVMFVGSIMVALAVEYCNLHRRLALNVMLCIGCSPRKLFTGLMIVTAFLSMWISNSACTSMMCPIAYAILEELESQGKCKLWRDDKNLSPDEPKYPSSIVICFFMGAAYASSLGGCGTLIGTPTNLVLKGLYESRFPNATENLDFPIFMAYAMPPMICYTTLTIIAMQVGYLGLFRPNSDTAKSLSSDAESEEAAKQVIRGKLSEMGPMNCHETSILILFLILVALYCTIKPGFVDGWADYLDDVQIKNSAPTMAVVLLLFILPLNYNFITCNSDKLKDQKFATRSLISWPFLHARVPWGLVFLIGGGFALSAGSRASGFAELVGTSLSVIEDYPSTAIVLVAILMGEFFTEFSVNVAVGNIILPVLFEMCVTIKVHPLKITLPATIACSMPFHLPCATAPNAIVAGYMNIRTVDMMVAGIAPTIITTAVIFVFEVFWTPILFPAFDTFPDWAV